MIVSHKHKMIFFHCRKTGGSAVKLNLYPHLGEDDIVIGGLSEIIEQGYKLNRAARSALKTPVGATYYAAQRLRGVSHAGAANYAIKMRHLRLTGLTEHDKAVDVKLNFQKEFARYFKFAFVRNPFTQVISDYYWRLRNTGKEMSLSAYLDLLNRETEGNNANSTQCKNFDMISLEGEVICDFVGRFENLYKDFKHVTERLGIDCNLESFAKVGQRAASEYGNLYERGDREKVEALFSNELEEFGYTWPFG